MNPVVLFLCVHNAGRSQMAAGWLRHLAAGRVDVLSAGSEPAERVRSAVHVVHSVFDPAPCCAPPKTGLGRA